MFGLPLPPIDRLLVGWIAVGFSVSLAIAFSDLQDAGWMPWFATVMMSVVKSIGPWSRASADPPHTAIFFSTMWGGSPLLLYLLFIERHTIFPLDKWRVDRALRATAAAVVMAAAVVAFSFFGIGGGMESAHGSTSRHSFSAIALDSHLSTGLFGSAMIFFTWYCVLAAGIFLDRTIKGMRK